MRMDKMGVVLNYGQTPLIKSRYLEYINHEEQPYGVNAIVAIMSYTGYNVEDAILINEGSVKRGIFRTTYYTTYEAREESARVSGSNVNTTFSNIESKPNVKGIKEGFDYSKLDKYGIVKENTVIDDRVVLIGELTSSVDQRGTYIDHSKTTKKGQLGFVDKSFISEGDEGFRIAKVRIREERLPAIGDKMASRAGQKGTLGLIIPEEDMPFTADGIRPDLIINPHAIPSRMTIGQLVESLFGKACCMYGAYGDCTAFATKGANYHTYGHMLTKMGYHNSGNQLLYNGFTGEQIYSEIFIGPTYYMRLKHMVKDKINYRATGKRNFLTRQTNQGRANDGGLKIGEMERDGIMANGLSYFLNESYMIRGDQYFMGICNKTGAIAIYNPDTNLFLSPFADGPLVFNKNVEGQEVLNAISKFGRSFSIVRIPFALKLLIQELQVMNIQMRVITEDNIDQLMNLSYQSRNIDKLLHIDPTGVQQEVNLIIENYTSELNKQLSLEGVTHRDIKYKQYEGVSPRSLDTTPEQPTRPEYEAKSLSSEDYETGYSPPGIISNSLQYAQGSPAYIPDSNSPQYAPGSPAYKPYSPSQSYNIDDLLVNKEPEKDWEASPPWAPPFDDTNKNDVWNQLPRHVQDNIIKLNIQDKELEFDIVNQAIKKIIYNKTGIIPQTPDISPDVTPLSELAPPPSRGGANIFPNDPIMNEAFNNLGGAQQSQILQLSPQQRGGVMAEIMRRTIRQTAGMNYLNKTNDPLGGAFDVLPVDKKLLALQGGYGSMAKEFGGLANRTHSTSIKITKPVSMSEQLAGKYPLLAVDQKVGDKKNTDNSISNDTTSSINDTNSSTSSNGGTIKKISF
jgi:hypothetical protein